MRGPDFAHECSVRADRREALRHLSSVSPAFSGVKVPMTVMAPVGSRLYSVLLRRPDDRPGTWLTVAADDLVDAIRRARGGEWCGDSAPEWSSSARIEAVECLGPTWH